MYLFPNILYNRSQWILGQVLWSCI